MKRTIEIIKSVLVFIAKTIRNTVLYVEYEGLASFAWSSALCGYIVSVVVYLAAKTGVSMAGHTMVLPWWGKAICIGYPVLLFLPYLIEGILETVREGRHIY